MIVLATSVVDVLAVVVAVAALVLFFVVPGRPFVRGPRPSGGTTTHRGDRVADPDEEFKRPPDEGGLL
jgi:hypothetical protein